MKNGKRSLLQLLSVCYGEEWHLSELRREFARKDYVNLPHFLKDEALEFIKGEAQALEELASKRSFQMPEWQTPREMKALGGLKILEEAQTLWSLPQRHDIIRVVEAITGCRVFDCLNPQERIVANFLAGSGSTHGLHLDDDAFALIICLEAPPASHGGQLEFIRDWPEICEKLGVPCNQNVAPIVEMCRVSDPEVVQVRHHRAGDAYLLRANTCLHRVTPLTVDRARRVAIAIAYASTPNPIYGKTADTLYGEQ